MKKDALIVAIILSIASVGNSEVLTGQITHMPENLSFYSWGDGVHNLQSMWSSRNNNSGYVYGTNQSSNYTADIYVYSGLTDIKQVGDASVFAYTKTNLVMYEGNYIFFKGTNGYYGAWRIDNVYFSGGTGYLDGQWYFQDDKSGNFVPEPATIILLAFGGLMLRKRS